MEENREPLSAIAIEKKLQLLRNKHFSEDTIALVKSDYEYGLTEEKISLYLNKSYDIEQMKILSECLHKDVPKDVIDIIKNTKYSVHQMQAVSYTHLDVYKRQARSFLSALTTRMDHSKKISIIQLLRLKQLTDISLMKQLTM